MLRFIITAFIPTHPRSERGATATEYALLVGLIAVVIAGAVLTFGGVLGASFTSYGAWIDDNL